MKQKGGGKTVHVVCKYLSKACYRKGLWMRSSRVVDEIYPSVQMRSSRMWTISSGVVDEIKPSVDEI